MSFCYHLRAYKDIGATLAEFAEDLLVGKFGGGGVGIHTKYPRFGEDLAEFFFNLLGAKSHKSEVLAAALVAKEPLSPVTENTDVQLMHTVSVARPQSSL